MNKREKKLFCLSLFNSSNQVEPQTSSPPLRQFPISYIRAFAYHPVAFPQPLAPITTYQVSRNPQSYNPSRNMQSNGFSGGLGNALSQVFQQKFIQGQDNPQNGFQSANSVISQPTTQQQLPMNGQVEFGTPPTSTTTTTTTTTPAPVTTQAPMFSGSQPHISTRNGFSDGYQRQLPIAQNYQAGNFGGFPQYYNQPYNQQFSPFQYNEQPAANQFTGRVFGGESSYQQYSTDPLTYQFIPTSITQLPTPQQQNNVKFVPCMCPVAVSISPPIEKRSEEIPILNPTTETESLSQSVQSSTQQNIEERK